MEHIFSIIGSFTPILQLAMIVLLCVIFWEPIAQKVFGYEKAQHNADGSIRERSSKDWFDDISDVVKDQSLQLKMMAGLMGELAQHYNHDTTELLSKINDNMQKIVIKQEEWDKFGIPTRDCKTGIKSL